MNPKKWKLLGQYTSYKRHKVFFQNLKNEGKSYLVLFHGFPTSSFDWHKMIDELSDHFSILYFDMIGYGFSDKPIQYNYSIKDQSDLAIHLLKENKITTCHILAHDKGDTVANELIARQNKDNLDFQILSCCFLNGGLFPGIHKPRPIQWLLMTPLGKFLTPFYTKWMLTKTFNNIFGKVKPTKEEMDEFWCLLNYNQGRKVFHKLIWYMQDRIDNKERWLKALQETQIPLQLIDGEDDSISGKHMADHYKEVIPNPNVVYLKNIGHYPNLEAPKEVLHHFFQFHQIEND